MGSSAATMPFTALLERVDHASVVIIPMIVRSGFTGIFMPQIPMWKSCVEYALLTISSLNSAR
jgi:hypothetical protein